ncbi:unnamed protein product [Choristocarpus tenellus]
MPAQGHNTVDHFAESMFLFLLLCSCFIICIHCEISSLVSISPSSIVATSNICDFTRVVHEFMLVMFETFLYCSSKYSMVYMKRWNTRISKNQRRLGLLP